MGLAYCGRSHGSRPISGDAIVTTYGSALIWMKAWRRECTRIRTVADLLPWRRPLRAMPVDEQALTSRAEGEIRAPSKPTRP